MGASWRCFPGEIPPEAQHLLDVPEDALRGAGLSRAKTAAVRDLAAKTLDGTVPSLTALRAMNDEEIIQRLTAVRGVGRWTAEMLLIFRLGRRGRPARPRPRRAPRLPAHLRPGRPPSTQDAPRARRAVGPVPLGRKLVPLGRAAD